MEIKHLTKLTCSILYVFIMTFAKDISSAASSLSHQVSNHQVLLAAPADPLTTNNFGKDKATQFHNVQNVKQNLDSVDAESRWRLSEDVDTNNWSSTNGVRRKRWSGFSAWGKRSPAASGAYTVFPESHGNGLRDKRKWSGFSSWGKRHHGDSFEIPADKRWKEMSVWGKRDDAADKRWKEMSVWGKRDNIENLKKWKDMSVWGKRHNDEDEAWREMALWGKRKPEEHGKKWKSLSAWGKRTSDNQFDTHWKELSNRDDTNVDKILDNKSLADKGEEKYQDKKWNEMAVWGKRKVEPLDISKWDNIGLWGKRSFKHIRNWRDMDMWGKRPSWSKTGFTSWGKRSNDMDIVSN